jgi:threonine/homoserine/homoserine lactone efflux protein
MSFAELSVAVLLLLLTPGPTNTLILLAGAERGLGGAVRLIPVELLGYLLTILPLTLVGAEILADHPGLRAGVTVCASLWVAFLAVKLWQVPDGGTTFAPVGSRAVFVTTALNPKALIFGLVLLPSPERLLANIALFAGLVVLVALIWATLGAFVRTGGARQPRSFVLLRRLASVWLAAISVVLMVRGAAA